MEEILKKIPLIDIDTLSSKPIRIKSQIYIGDSALITLQLKENGTDKVLHEGCSINILYSDMEGRNVREQKDKITIEGNLISFVPSKLIIGVNKIELCISDADEIIYLCPLILNVLATTENDVIVDNANDIQTLKDLKEYVDTASEVLKNTDKQITLVGEKIEALTSDIAEADSLIKDTVEELKIEVHEALVNANTKIDTELDNMVKKIENKFDEFNSGFSKISKLEPYLNSSNKVCFRTELINKTAKDLTNYSFMLHVNGSPYVNSITTQLIGILTFSIESSGVVANLNVLTSKGIQGNSIQISSIKFSTTNSNIINQNEYGYQIVIETNIIKTALDSAKCCLTPLTTGGLL